MDLGLKGKIAMVAGASKGLGYAVARGLAAEGVKVSIASRDEASVTGAASRIAAETYTDTLGTAVDVRSADAIAAWHARTIEKFGGVDLLYVNSGGPPAGAALSFDDEAWKNAFDLPVLSAVRVCARVDDGAARLHVTAIVGGAGAGAEPVLEYRSRVSGEMSKTSRMSRPSIASA